MTMSSINEKIKVRYIDKNLDKLIITDKGDLIDLRCSNVKLNGEKVEFNEEGKIQYKAGDVLFIGFGVAIKLPQGFKACLYPRSSTFKNYGLILTNSVGQIDNSYSGNNDEYKGMFYALKDGEISYNDRVAQFDITKIYIRDYVLEEVEELDSVDRGSYGSTGNK
jgi:dUTP pyrophosphatase